jgi:predicted TIM-barrel fold metal-dependent hydrolase
MTDASPPPARPPGWQLPQGSCDSHTHIFGPYDRFPVVHQMHYTPPFAPVELHLDMRVRTGLERGVIVQPGAYGSDPELMIDALSASGGQLRGICASSTLDEKTFDRWHAAGIRGLRFNDMTVPGGTGRFPGAVATEALDDLLPGMRARGWHAEIWGPIDRHADLIPRYRSLGIPVVLDHMASLVVSRGVDDLAFRKILRALQEGWLWVKLVLCRCSQAFPDYADLRPFHDALIAANPNHLVWGSDWPHLRLADRAPDVGHLLDLFREWEPDETVRHRILVKNPAELYDF